MVGSREDDTRAGGHNAGSAYVFVRSGTTWSQQAKLTASDGADYDAFGFSVSVDGDTVAVGAVTGHSTASVNAGAAYVFVRSGRTSWTQQAKLDASDGADWDYFGWSVSVDGDTVVVGAPGDDSSGRRCWLGIFVCAQRAVGLPVWIQQAKLTASDGADWDEFGDSVSVDGHTLVVGAPWDDTAAGKDQSGSRTSLSLGCFPTSGHLRPSREALPSGRPRCRSSRCLDRQSGGGGRSIGQGRCAAALDRVRAFINQVDAYIDARILSPAEGRTLIDQANDIIGFVRR